MAVRDQRARVLYRLPEQRRFGAGGMPTMVTMVLLAVVLFLGGMVIGRATMTRDAPTGAATATTAAASAVPGAVAATPGTAAAPGTAEAAASSRVGPRRFEAGVGVGYAHSSQGAVAAAANYTRALSSDLILDTSSRRAAIDALAAPEARSRLQKTFDQAVVPLRQG